MLHLVICNAHSLVDAFGGSSLSEMVRNRILECPTCFKQVRSDLLKSHCKSKHDMSDHEITLLKTYSCKYCKKNFSRRVNCGENTISIADYDVINYCEIFQKLLLLHNWLENPSNIPYPLLPKPCCLNKIETSSKGSFLGVRMQNGSNF